MKLSVSVVHYTVTGFTAAPDCKFHVCMALLINLWFVRAPGSGFVFPNPIDICHQYFSASHFY